MEIHLKPETESRLKELVSQSGRPVDELVEDAMAAYLTEVAKLRDTLDDRYDDIKSGRVKPIDGEAFFEALRRREQDLPTQRSPEMNDDQGFELHPGAVEDITEIWQFIAEDNPAVAAHFREEILEAIHNLVAFPHQGHRRPDLTSWPLRFRIIREYLIAYAPDERPLLVIAVIHGRRNPRIMAAVLRGRG